MFVNGLNKSLLLVDRNRGFLVEELWAFMSDEDSKKHPQVIAFYFCVSKRFYFLMNRFIKVSLSEDISIKYNP